MTVLAATPLGCGRVVGVLLRLVPESLVTLETGLVPPHPRCQLVVGPVPERRAVRRRGVHQVTARAVELAPDESGGVLDPVSLATDDGNLAVGPEAVFHEVGLDLLHEDHGGIFSPVGGI